MACNCKQNEGAEQPIDKRIPDEVVRNGTVIDYNTGLKGVVTSISPFIVKASDPNRTVLVTLEEGYAGVFAPLSVGDSVFCVVSATRMHPPATDGTINVDATCYYILNFGTIATSINTIITHPPLNTASAELKTAATAALNALSDNVGESTMSSTCVIASMKALANPSAAAKIAEIINDGYPPYDSDCTPAPVVGVINVVFRFRNVYGQERALVVPVRLRTWPELMSSGAMLVAGSSVTEVSPLKWCSPVCVACRVACRTVQASCIAAFVLVLAQLLSFALPSASQPGKSATTIAKQYCGCVIIGRFGDCSGTITRIGEGVPTPLVFYAEVGPNECDSRRVDF